MSDQYSGPERRARDPIQEQIEQLIMSATDPKDKAFLLILNKIADNLDENTTLTRTLTEDLKSHTEAFAQHEKDEMALINQGRGFWRAALGAMFLVQGLGVWWIQGHLAETAETASKVAHLQIQMAEHKEHHKQEERYRDGVKVTQ